MARVAYVMEGIMSKLGLSGKAFIPMLLGFGCTVPAIMASRALENKRDRFKVMLVTPFMSCNARLTIYILFSEMFFGDNAMLMAYSMYLIGIVVAIVVSAVIHLLDRKKSVNYLMIELPEYKLPDFRTVAIYVWEKVKDYLEKAGTTIFIATLVIWFLLNFGPQGYSPDMSQSFGSMLGKWIVPFFAPIGLGFWQIAVALIAGISAKEVVVSSCAVRHCQRQLAGRNDRFCLCIERHRLWAVQCLLPNGILLALYPLCGGSGYYPQGIGKLCMDGFYRHFPVVGGVDCHFCSVPDWIFCSALSKLFLQRVQMEEVYMASLILLIVLAVYCIWSLRRMVKRRKENRGKCAGCPYQGTGMCR